tara:strand:+ start:427 stop:738 length:312 start_codon:yes stop_codon:yes gene_type:complete
MNKITKMIKVKTRLRPGIITSNGKTYAVGGNWIEIPNGTELKDIAWDKPFVAAKPRPKGKSVEVIGSKGNKYTVTHNPVTNIISCTCPGFSFRKKCKHQKELK